jgi:hypothetical protein
LFFTGAQQIVRDVGAGSRLATTGRRRVSMERPALLVTSDGRRVLPETDGFFTALARLVPGSDPVGFAVRELGFVKFQPQGSVTIVELDERTVDPRALLRAERQIAECGAAAFSVRPLRAGRADGRSLSAADAVARLRQLLARPEQPAAAGRFAAEPHDYARLLRQTDDPFCRLGRKWCASFGAFDAGFMDFVGDNDLLSRLIVFAVKPRTEEVVFRYIGDGHNWLTRHYRTDPIGDTVDNQPDKEYAAWVSQFHRAVARSGEPRFDTVSATLCFGAEPPYDVRYERLLLPWKSASDESVVTMVSRMLWRSIDGAAAN